MVVAYGKWRGDIKQGCQEELPSALKVEVFGWISDYIKDLVNMEHRREPFPTICSDPDWDALFGSMLPDDEEFATSRDLTHLVFSSA